MKSFLFIIGVSFIVTSCDPLYIMYLKNETGERISVDVVYENLYEIGFDSIRYTDREIKDLKPRHIDSLLLKKAVVFNNSNQYSFVINNNQTVLLEPLSIGRPIKEVIFEYKNEKDTIFDFRDKELYQKLKSKGILVKKGLSTTIIYLQNIDNE